MKIRITCVIDFDHDDPQFDVIERVRRSTILTVENQQFYLNDYSHFEKVEELENNQET